VRSLLLAPTPHATKDFLKKEILRLTSEHILERNLTFVPNQPAVRPSLRKVISQTISDDMRISNPSNANFAKKPI
jgi:hypothetical protein